MGDTTTLPYLPYGNRVKSSPVYFVYDTTAGGPRG